MTTEPMYNPLLSYEENYERGPFGYFAEPGSTLRRDAAARPRYSFLGHPVWLPFGIPAGPLLNGNFVRAALDKGFDIPVYKTVRTRRYKSHAWPNVLPVQVEGELQAGTRLTAGGAYTQPLSITNSFGVPSMDPDVWQPDLAACVQHARAGQVVVGSYQGTLPEHGGMAEYLADFRLGARLMRETGVRVVEVNFSCPNEGTAHLLCFDVARSRAVAEAIREELGPHVALMVKIAYFKDDAQLEQFVREVGPAADAITAINTISAEVVDESGTQALPGEGRLWSGVCGSAIKWAGLGMTLKLLRLREALGMTFAVVGVGGVTTADDFVEYRAAGADAVMSATGAMWDPRLAEKVWEREMAEVQG